LFPRRCRPKWLTGWSAAATFQGAFSDVTRSYAGKGVVRYAWWDLELEYAQHDRADKGECDIRGDDAQSPHEWTGENHGKAPWFTSLPALTPEIAIGSGRKRSALLSFRAITIAGPASRVVKES
jgi:hypothetical protein